MKGRTPTQEEREFMDKIARIGCIACRKMGFINHHISLHHFEGRTKEGAHFKVLPLCERHHQIKDNIKPPRWETIHDNKSRFEKVYGTERELYTKCLEIIKSDTYCYYNELDSLELSRDELNYASETISQSDLELFNEVYRPWLTTKNT